MDCTVLDARKLTYSTSHKGGEQTLASREKQTLASKLDVGKMGYGRDPPAA